MDKKILNEELQQMKYLFGYKAGKVISEQKGLLKENPATQPPPKTQPVKPGTKPTTGGKQTYTGRKPSGEFDPNYMKSRVESVGNSKPINSIQQIGLNVYCDVLKNKAEGKEYFISPSFPTGVITSVQLELYKNPNSSSGTAPFTIGASKLSFYLINLRDKVPMLYDIEMMLLPNKQEYLGDSILTDAQQLSNLCQQGVLKVYDGPTDAKIGNKMGNQLAIGEISSRRADLVWIWEGLGKIHGFKEAFDMINKINPNAYSLLANEILRFQDERQKREMQSLLQKSATEQQVQPTTTPQQQQKQPTTPQ